MHTSDAPYDADAWRHFEMRESYRAAALRKIQRRLEALDPVLQRFIRRMTVGGPCPSNLPRSHNTSLRLAAAALIDVLPGWRECQPDATVVFVTYAPERTHTSLAEPIIKVDQLLAQADQSLRRMGVEGLAVYDDVILHAGLNRRATEGTVLMPHVHVVGLFYGDIAGLKLAAKVERMRPSYRNSFASAIDVRVVGNTDEDLARIAGYLYKPTSASVQMRLQRGRPHRVKLDPIRARYSGRHALRQAEVHSHISVFDGTRGVGPAGTALRAMWRARVRELMVGGKFSLAISTRRLSARWEAVRSVIGPGSYKHCKVCTRGSFGKKKR